jgi:hypothetical protein
MTTCDIQMTSIAVPYLCEIDLNSCLKFGYSEVSKFRQCIQQGKAVFGHTPNVLILDQKVDFEWASLELLLTELDFGRVAICSSYLPAEDLIKLNDLKPNVEVNRFSESEKDEAVSWLISKSNT